MKRTKFVTISKVVGCYVNSFFDVFIFTYLSAKSFSNRYFNRELKSFYTMFIFSRLDTAILKFKNESITFKKKKSFLDDRRARMTLIIYEYSIERYFHTKKRLSLNSWYRTKYPIEIFFEASTDTCIFHIWKYKNLLNGTRCKISGFQF